MAAGTTLQLGATGHHSDLSQQNLTGTVSWTSSDETVATVTGLGRVDALKAGNATITAASGSVNRSAQLTVTARQVTRTSITVSPADPTIAAETALKLNATGNYSDGSSSDLTALATWTSSQPRALSSAS